MAEKVKRRVAAARLAVAFVAAGTIAGAVSWAQGAAPTAHPSAVDVFIKGENVVNGSLFFEDFHKREVPSFRQFVKFKGSETRFNKLTNNSISTIKGELSNIKGELGDIKTEVSTIKGELVSGYLKTTDADSRYLKLSDDVVRGDGSVFTASKLVDPQAQTFTPLLTAPGMLQVDMLGQEIRITNVSGGDLGHTECSGGNIPAGTLKNGQDIECFMDSGSTESIQFFSWGELEASATLSFSSVTDGQAQMTQNTVQILIGL